MTESKPFIDYSQYQNFIKCEWQWYEKYVAQQRKTRKDGYQDDAMTLGSLFHAAMQSYRLTGVPTINEQAIKDYNPSPECYNIAQSLALGYVRTYPNEAFTRYYCEEPIKFTLTDEVDGLAKIDSYFNVQEPTEIESGLGATFTLDPGWWIYEYKTKNASKNVGHYVEAWRVNMQANFQMLALRAKIGELPRGILVNVAEKAPEYVPKRTCKECKKQYELRDWLPTGSGYACPVCGNVQELDTSDKSKSDKSPKYYRLMVMRTTQELRASEGEMIEIANRMQELRTESPLIIRATERCIDHIYGPCDYWPAHSNLVGAKGFPGFVPVEALAYVTR